MKNRFYSIFGGSKALIAMIHVRALPGTPRYEGNFNHVLQKATEEAKRYADAGLQAVMIENMHDRPYVKYSPGPEITAALAVIGHEIKQKTGLITGIQILAAANKQALAVALAAGLDFIRAEGFVFGHLADEGYIEANAGNLLRYRKQIQAEHIAVFTDIKKKHSAHAISADTDITQHALAAEFFLSDGLIITGTETGKAPRIDEIKAVNNHTRLPVLLGSGINLDNIGNFFSLADGFIVGSDFKINGRWYNELDPEKLNAWRKLWNELTKRNL